MHTLTIKGYCSRGAVKAGQFVLKDDLSSFQPVAPLSARGTAVNQVSTGSRRELWRVNRRLKPLFPFFDVRNFTWVLAFGRCNVNTFIKNMAQ